MPTLRNVDGVIVGILQIGVPSDDVWSVFSVQEMRGLVENARGDFWREL